MNQLSDGSAAGSAVHSLPSEPWQKMEIYRHNLFQKYQNGTSKDDM